VSTRPIGRSASRRSCSVISVCTFEAFSGHEIQDLVWCFQVLKFFGKQHQVVMSRNKVQEKACQLLVVDDRRIIVQVVEHVGRDFVQINAHARFDIEFVA